MSPVMGAMQGAGEGLETSDRGIQGGPQAMPNEAAEAAVQPSEIDVVEAAHAALASLPAECATESDRLLALCEKLVEVCPPPDFHDPLRAWMNASCSTELPECSETHAAKETEIPPCLNTTDNEPQQFALIMKGHPSQSFWGCLLSSVWPTMVSSQLSSAAHAG